MLAAPPCHSPGTGQDQGWSSRDDIFPALVDGLDKDRLLAAVHAEVLELNFETISGRHNINESRYGYIGRRLVKLSLLKTLFDDLRATMTFCSTVLHILPSCSTRPHALGNITREGHIVREVWINMGHVEVTGSPGRRFLSHRGGESGGSFGESERITYIIEM